MSAARRRIARAAAIALLAPILFLKPNPARVAALSRAGAQEGLRVENPQADAEFGKTIVFSARIISAIPIQQASLLFRGAREEATRVETLDVAEDGSTQFVYDASLNAFPPFSQIVYWFQATLSDGKTYTSEQYSLQYDDDRFPWRETSRANVVIHWYAGDDAFGAAALDSAGAGLLAMKDFIPVSFTDPIHIYIYSNVKDLSDTMLLGGRAWAGGHAHADLGVALVAVAPGANQFAEMGTLIPHEMTHIMLYRSLGEGYNRQPVWLVEGIASMMEGYPNPDYARALEIAGANDTLIPIADLCAPFPADSGSAFLAYAQSQSFVSYIRDSFGVSGLSRLTATYADGFECELGATKALGASLVQLDLRWRENVLGQNRAGVALRNLLPFLLLLSLVLIVPVWGAIDLVRQRRKHAVHPR